MNKELIELLKEAYNAGIIYEDSKGEQMCWTEFLYTIKNKQLNLLNSSLQLKENKIPTFEDWVESEEYTKKWDGYFKNGKKSTYWTVKGRYVQAMKDEL